MTDNEMAAISARRAALGQMGVKPIRVFHLQNVVAPYVLPLFDALGQEWDFHVFYCKEKAGFRRWSTAFENHAFKGRVLPHLDAGPFVVNWSLPKQLFAGPRFDAYMFADNLPNVLSIALVVIAAKLRRRPLIMWTAVMESEYDKGKKGKTRLFCEVVYRRFVAWSAHAFVALSESAAALLERHGVARERIFRTAYFTEGDAPLPCSKAEAKERVGLRGSVVLFVGYLFERKGLKYLLEAVQQLARPDVTLLIAGDGPDADQVRSQFAGNDMVRLIGHVDGEAKQLAYTAADIFVLPSLHDDWGLVVNEAMSYGLPVIVTDAVACRHDLVRGNGLVVPSADSAALREALDKLLSDEDLRKQMGARSLAINRTIDLDYAKKGFLAAVESQLPWRSRLASTTPG